MLDICDNFAREHSVIFNAHKFKCLLVSTGQRLSHVTKEKHVFYIGGSVIEFVARWPHLGSFYAI